MNGINQNLINAGVVWHNCEGCGRVWPFPTGFSTNRAWRCGICLYALWAKLKRIEDSK